jgi:hypothetical protein
MQTGELGPSELVDVGVDWLTLTVPNKHPRLNDFRLVACEEILRLKKEPKQKWTEKLMQFQGEGTAEFFWGEMPTHHILQSRGQNAKHIIEQLRREQLFGTVTRIDAQITTKTGAEEPDFAEGLRDRIGRRKVRNQKGIRCAVNSFEGARCDSGFSWGNRTSESSGKCYDAHQRHPIRYEFGARRVECQFIGTKANSVYSMFMAGDSQEDLAWRLCASEWQRFGFDEPWMHGFSYTKPKGKTVRSCDEKTIYWLVNMVAPVLARIVKSDQTGLVYRTFFEALHPPVEERRGETRPEVAKLKRQR